MVHLGSPGGARCVVWVKWWGCGLGWDTIAVVGAGLGRHFVMIDIFHISRICCKGTHYLRHYRKCASFFISHGLFLRRRGGLTQISTDGVVRFMTDFHGFAAVVLVHGFCGWLSHTDLTDFTDFFISQIADFAHGFCGWLSHTDLADFADFFISQISRFFCRGGVIAHRFHRFHGFFYLTDCWLVLDTVYAIVN